jgi:hypothetical protein
MKFVMALSLCTLCLSPIFGEMIDGKMSSTQCIPSKEVALQQAMRKLWSDHVIWTRLYIISAVSKSTDLSVVTTRLLKNQEDIGNAIIPYYGKEAGAALTKLLKEHIMIAGDLVGALIANAKDDAKRLDQKWHDNAAAMADFLSKANSYWSRQDLLNMLNRHLALTAQEVTCRIEKKWEKDVSTFDQIFIQALGMADTLSAGISRQFSQ